MYRSRYQFFVAIAFSALTLVASCSEDDEFVQPQDSGFPPALSQAELMTQLETVHEDMDYRGYTQILDPAFKFILKPATVLEFSLPEDHFTYGQDLQITELMFSGDPASEDVPGISSISFIDMVIVTPWEEAQDTEFPGASYAKYFVHLEFWQGSGDARQLVSVRGEIDFYLSAETITYEGKERLRYRLAGQIDRTAGKSGDPMDKPNEDTSWGGFKALFRQ